MSKINTERFIQEKNNYILRWLSRGGPSMTKNTGKQHGIPLQIDPVEERIRDLLKALHHTRTWRDTHNRD